MTWPKHTHLLKGLNFVCALAALAMVSLFPDKVHAQCTINMSGADQQTIDGFGAFSAWGGPISSEQGATLFGTGSGQLGLSLFRCYVDDERQGEARSHTELAHSYGVKVLGSCWSPPASMKSNNNIIGGSLLPSAYGAYADFLADAAQVIGVDYISFQNEPDFLPGNYAGCQWTSSELETFCLNNAPTVGKPIVMAESFNFNTALTDTTLNNSKAAKNFAIVAEHLYGATPSVYQNALDRNKRIWMTENCLEENDFNSAMETAQEISDCMNCQSSDCMNCQSSAYIWWWINAGKSSFINGGTIDTRGYILGQFSRFIRPSSTRVGATYEPQAGVFVTAYRVNGGCTLVAFNRNTNPVSQQFNIQNGTASELEGYQTSATQSIAAIGNFNVTGGSFTVTLPAQSVTTFVQSTLPVIVQQPLDITVYPGADAMLSVAAAGTQMNYQWYFNGTNALPGATSPVLKLTRIQASRMGTYSVVISNGTGSVTSDAVSLTTHPLVWSALVTISSETDVSTSGTLLYAYSNSGSGATVNGVSFTGVDSATAWGTGVNLNGYDASVTSAFTGGPLHLGAA